MEEPHHNKPRGQLQQDSFTLDCHLEKFRLETFFTRTTLTTADVRLDIMSPSVFNGDSWLKVLRSDPLLPDLQLTQSSSLNMAALFEFLNKFINFQPVQIKLDPNLCSEL